MMGGSGIGIVQCYQPYYKMWAQKGRQQTRTVGSRIATDIDEFAVRDISKDIHGVLLLWVSQSGIYHAPFMSQTARKVSYDALVTPTFRPVF